jgi:Zn-dependent peptidase ImmA (M78 family)
VDEQDVVLRAREFMRGLDLTNIGDSLEPYLAKANARVRKDELGEGQSGTVAFVKGKTVITVNEAEPEERQRFTICHELGHKVLVLSSSHEHIPQWGFAKRDVNEVLCDIFAAELLMPTEQFMAACRGLEPSLDSILTLQEKFKTSFPATASRFARLVKLPCCFVTMQGGIVKYAAMSTPLRALGGRITLRSPIPERSVAARVRAAQVSDYAEDDVAQDVWLENWSDGLDMRELSRHHKSTDTTLSLFWFDEEDAPRVEVDRFGQRVEEDDGLKELTGVLTFEKR